MARLAARGAQTLVAGLAMLLIARCVAAGGTVQLSREAQERLDAQEAAQHCEAVLRDSAGGANAIVRENCLEGSPPEEWDVNGAGDPTIQGFAAKMSVEPGEVLPFKVKTDAEQWRIDIYRLGYYGGRGARRVATVKPLVTLPQRQPECLREDGDGPLPMHLVDCGNWRVSAAWRVPDDAVSGLYFGRAVRGDNGQTAAKSEQAAAPWGDIAAGGRNWRADFSPLQADWHHMRAGEPEPFAPPPPQRHAYGASGHGALRRPLREPRASHLWFVVREPDDAERPSDVLLQTSDPTWQAYNGYGGLTSYGTFDFPATHGPDVQLLDPAATPRARALAASYNRPLITRGYRAVNAPLSAEYPAVRFLEANGFDVSYTSGLDASTRGALMARHRVALSVGHDEYWSKEQRDAWVAARDAGVHCMFWSGNEAYWRVRFEAALGDAGGDGAGAQQAAAAATENRTMCIFKDTQSTERLDPRGWTGTWRDARDINPDEPWPSNALTGTVWTVNAQRVDALEVPAEFRDMRMWRHTDVARLNGHQVYVSVKGVLGHEWDEDIDNGARPAGLVHMSRTTIDSVQYVQDHGSVFDTGSATHTVTLYRAESGALVLGTGTVQWSWGLDAHHDVNDPPRANMYDCRVDLDQSGPDHAVRQATINAFALMGVAPSTLRDDWGLVYDESVRDDTEAPVARITEINNQLGDTGRGAIRVAVAAEDAGGGVVAGVEVSLDGGEVWHPATRGTLAGGVAGWVLEWGLRKYDRMYAQYRAPDVDVVVRAIDDSARIGAPSRETCDPAECFDVLQGGLIRAGALGGARNEL